ncbi:SDR family NAD(P)-dependent oxidoreductase [Phytoactinopolyspora halotolerans]|uniref:SDR family oxidoreductase n=1 Tax=Phytoactinopolyspora halotolerans TaxID=1981512 RepID=A0A6L9S7F4_9ACTN|nr:SDR family oxidoreductase [Phytoactinopolyspora halotolerans]NEE01405.1 SDR family oxidoreductase [Phytoactinopolyspora halotolerans]
MTAAPFDLSGRRAVVTGAAHGLGAAFATGLAAAGADLVLIDRPVPTGGGAESPADGAVSSRGGADRPVDTGVFAVAEAVRRLGRKAHVVEADLAETAELAALVDRVWRTAGPVDILLNNAGIARLEHFNEVSVDAWRQVMRVNVDSVFFLSQRIAEHMIAGGIAGRIINVSSKNGVVAEAGLVHYNASKGAVELLSQSLAAELGPHGITVNTVAPGMIGTPIADGFDLADGFEQAWRERIPLGEYGTPGDCVGAVLLLASDAGRYITGTRIVVDGGVLADQLPRHRFMRPYRNTA